MLHLLTALALLAGAPAVATTPEAGAAKATTPEGRRLLLDCEKQFLRIESMKGTLKTRSIIHGGGDESSGVQERLTDFAYKRFDRVRFENTVPVPHSIIWNGTTLWIWSPQENAAVEKKADEITIAARSMLSLQPGFGLDLIAAIPLDAYLATASPAAASDVKANGSGDTVVILAPIDKTVPRATMQLVVDSRRKLVTRILTMTEVGGTLISDVRLSTPVEAKPGAWFATKVESRELLPDGSTLEQVRTFERLKFDVPIEDSKFEFRIPEGATVVPVADFNLPPASGTQK